MSNLIRNTLSTENENNLAAAVLKEYLIAPSAVSMIQGGTIKTVWKVEAEHRTFCLKRLKQDYKKSSFSVNAQVHIKKSGGNVPEIIKNRKGQTITNYNEQLFVLYEWIDGIDLNFSNPADLKASIQGLASFHIYSKGYLPDENSRISSKLGKWPEQYGSMLEKLDRWQKSAALNNTKPGYVAFIKQTPSIIKIGERALSYLNTSKYGMLTSEDSECIVLCHQDYGKGNALLTKTGICIIDLDGVTFDLPSRDLRKIIGKNAENKGRWNIAAINEICDWYDEINPLSKDERIVLYIDMLFPHWYYGLVKNMFQGDKSLRSEEIEWMAKLEQSKAEILLTLLFSRGE